MPDSSGSLYRLVWFSLVLAQLRAWVGLVAARGILDSYVAALKAITEKLTTDPMGWGDPLYGYHVLGLQMYRGLRSPFVVIYAVDELRRIVYVTEVQPFPGSGLDTEAP